MTDSNSVIGRSTYHVISLCTLAERNMFLSATFSSIYKVAAKNMFP